MSQRFDGKVFDFTQPDGTSIRVRGFGDQTYAVFQTLDGYTVTTNPATGFRRLLQVDAADSGKLNSWRLSIKPS